MIHAEDLLFDNMYPILVNPRFLSGDPHFCFQMNYYFQAHMPTRRRFNQQPPAVESTFYNPPAYMSPKIYVVNKSNEKLSEKSLL